MDKVILIVLSIFIIAFLMIIFIIVLVAKKTLRTLSENKRYLPEQKRGGKINKVRKIRIFSNVLFKKISICSNISNIKK